MEQHINIEEYLAWAVKMYRSDKRKYGADTAGHNLYVNARAAIDPKWREEYGGWDTRYRCVGKKAA